MDIVRVVMEGDTVLNSFKKHILLQNSDYIENTLIKLKRKYGKDELVLTLIKQLKEKAIENGQLKAEIDYLNNEIKQGVKQKEVNKLALIEIQKELLYKSQEAQIKIKTKRITELVKLNKELVGKLAKQTWSKEK